MNTTKLKDAKEVLRIVKERDIETFDFKFLDLAGRWQHVSRTAGSVDESTLRHGVGFEGGRFRGWEDLRSHAAVLLPDLATIRMDPLLGSRCLSLQCELVDPLTGVAYARDPRAVVRRAEAHAMSVGVADELLLSAAVEFFAFSDVRFEERVNSSFCFVDTPHGHWNSGNDERPNLGHKSHHGGFPSGPVDGDAFLRDRIVSQLTRVGVPVVSSHPTGAPGQHRIELGARGLIATADHLQWLKYLTRGLAQENGRAATFMPQPLAGCLGSGMQLRCSMRKGDHHTFVGDMYAGLSDTALHFVGGVLRHAPALAAFTNPTVNSYRRLASSGELGLGYSSRASDVAVRIPSYSPSPRAKRVEYVIPDPSANVSLALAAFVMAGLHGIERKQDPGEPRSAASKVKPFPRSLEEALEALASDHKWLTRGGVFSDELIQTWIKTRREDDVEPMRRQPTPGEFSRYFDI